MNIQGINCHWCQEIDVRQCCTLTSSRADPQSQRSISHQLHSLICTKSYCQKHIGSTYSHYLFSLTPGCTHQDACMHMQVSDLGICTQIHWSAQVLLSSCRSWCEAGSQPLVHEIAPVLAQQHNKGIVLLVHGVPRSLIQCLRWLILEPAENLKFNALVSL